MDDETLEEEQSSVQDTVADALERELTALTGQTMWDRLEIEAAAQRILWDIHRVELQISRLVRLALEDDDDG